jgi:hypothetical protein
MICKVSFINRNQSEFCQSEAHANSIPIIRLKGIQIYLNLVINKMSDIAVTLCIKN